MINFISLKGQKSCNPREDTLDGRGVYLFSINKKESAHSYEENLHLCTTKAGKSVYPTRTNHEQFFVIKGNTVNEFKFNGETWGDEDYTLRSEEACRLRLHPNAYPLCDCYCDTVELEFDT